MDRYVLDMLFLWTLESPSCWTFSRIVAGNVKKNQVDQSS
jgi:hypothetical protein